jgi:hypothetical protein
MDLQWETAPNNNARPCANERKASGAKTMASNAKNNAPQRPKQCDTRPVYPGSDVRPRGNESPPVSNGGRRRAQMSD